MDVAPVLREYSSRDAIPFHLLAIKHRYSRFFLYGWTLFWTTGLAFGWQHMSELLFRGGAYVWLCGSQTVETGAGHNTALCDSQYNAVQALFTFGLFCEFGLAIVAGWSLDYMGPGITGLIGLSGFSIGCISLAFSSESLPFYVLTFVFLTGSINFTAYSALVLSDLFPKHSVLAMSYVVACQLAATLVPPILVITWNSLPAISFQQLILMWWGTIVVPTSLLMIMSLPWQSTKSEIDTDFSDSELKHEDTISYRPLTKDLVFPESPLNRILLVSPQDQILPKLQDHVFKKSEQDNTSVEPHDNMLLEPPQDNILLEPPQDNILLESQYTEKLPTAETSECDESDGLNTQDIDTQCQVHDCQKFSKVLVHVHEESAEDNTTSQNNHQAMTPKYESALTAIRTMASKQFYLFAIHNTVVVMLFTYYPTTVRKEFGGTIAHLQGMLLPTQSIWAILSGVLEKRTNTLVMSWLITFMAAAMMGMAMQPSDILQYGTTVVYILASSYIFTLKYTYCDHYFDKKNFGVYTGAIGLMNGMCALLNIPLRHHVPYDTACVMYLALCVPCVLMLLLLTCMARNCHTEQPYEKEVEESASWITTEETTSTAD